MKERRLSDYYPLWIELIILLIIGWVFYYVITTYPELPDKIPTHFGGSGKPDGWSQKSWKTVLTVPCIEVGMYILMTLISVAIFKTSNPLDAWYVNIPFSSSKNLTPEGIEKTRKLLIQLLTYMKGIIVLTFAWIEYASIQVALGLREGLGEWFSPVSMVALFGVVGWMVFRIYLVSKKDIKK